MFAQPWAWLGLAGIAVPVAIHLLARHQAVRTRFPSLRFIAASDVNFIRLRTLSDLPLLLVRVAIVAVAVAALAGPRWGSASAPGSGRVVAVVVDNSAGAAGDDGRNAARAATVDAASSVVVESASLSAGIASASRWLERQTGRRELVIVSDFQRGALSDDAFATVPTGAGVRFVSLKMFPAKLPPGFELRGDRSRMTWPSPSASLSLPLTVKAGADQARAEAMLAAVASLAATTPVDANARRAVLVFPKAPERAALLAAPPINQPWMFDVVQPLLADAAMREAVTARASDGALVLLLAGDPQAESSSEVAATVLSALVQPLAWSEFEPEVIAAEQLRRWERSPADAPSVPTGEPQGRWLWAVVLALFGLETWMRRKTPRPGVEAPARVA